MSTHQASPDDGLRAARAFIARAEWVFAETMAAFAPHEYCTRRTCRERGIDAEFTAFTELIERQGYDRRWGRQSYRSVDIGSMTYWLHWEQWSPAERMQRAESGSAARLAFCSAICDSLPPGERRSSSTAAERRRNPRW